MSKIPVAALIADFRRMLRERWAYGADTKTGQVDCSGAFVWAYRQHGRSVYHGSNRMARVEVERLIPIGEATPAPGMAAFKRRAPGERGYALPSGYRPGGAHHTGDLNDYYHVGLIDEDASRVLNAQSHATGFVASPIAQGWSHVGYLRQVDYGSEGANPMTTMNIYAANGKAVNLRGGPSATAARVAQLPVGTPVALLAMHGDWAEVTAGARRGYVLAEYLAPADRACSAPQAEGQTLADRACPAPQAEGQLLLDRVSALEARVAALEGGGA